MPDDHIQTAPNVLEILRQILGEDGLRTGLAERELMSQDVWAKGMTAKFVAAPASVDQLCQTVRIASEHGLALNPRGGGMSYTGGYAPDRAGVGVLDFSRLDKIVEINAEDMYVTVQAGCTWKTLYEALKPLGLRTPFWGPLSGIKATIGGSLSQNNAFFGAGIYGTSANSVNALSVVMADGTLVRTGTSGTEGGKPFWRSYGPDLTGLFLGDAGALGHKAEATLRLIPTPEHADYASFEFPSLEACASAMGELARQNLACEIVGFDPNLQRVRMTRASLLADTKALGNVSQGQGSLLKGLKEGAKVALAGRKFMDEAAYSLHMTVEGRSQAGVAEDIVRLKEICKTHQGKEIENSIPKIIRANPFGPLNAMLGPQGQRWVPVHGIVPISQGPAVWAEIDAMFEAMREELDRHEILTGYLVTTLGTTCYVIEPVFLWPEEIFPLHEASVEADALKKLPRHKPNPEATALVDQARKRVVEIFTAHQGAHLQIGRTYPYKPTRNSETLALLEAIKAHVDPDGKINPGALGFNEAGH